MPTIYTHSGHFHPDEVTGCAMLMLFNPEFDIVRTRDPEVLEKACPKNDFVLDVGKTFDPDSHRYDHHQLSFDETFDDKSTIPLSSAGLVWKYHGKDICLKIINQEFATGLGCNADAVADITVTKVYQRFVKYIDANDNGVIIDSSPVSYGCMISRFNSLFSDLTDDGLNLFNSSKNDRKDSAFRCAVDTAQTSILALIIDIMTKEISYLQEYVSLANAFAGRSHPEIMELDFKPNNISRFLNEVDAEQEVKFIVVPRIEDDKQLFQIYTVDYDHEKFNTYVPILDESDAIELFGDQIRFVHKNRFMAVVETKKAGVALASASLTNYLTYGNLPYRVKRLFKWGCRKAIAHVKVSLAMQ